jgi:hypothetical protein
MTAKSERQRQVAGTDHPDVAGGLAAHPAERAYTFQGDDKMIDLDALVAELELG